MTSTASCTASTLGFRGWQAACLTNEWLNVTVVPDIGGRIMAYNLGDYAYLFVDPGLAGKLFSAAENMGDGTLAYWKNYGGSKTWPAPQGWDGPDQWPGPPDPILDTGRYTLVELTATPERAGLTVVSPSGSSTGVQITRTVRIRAGSSRLALHLAFTNQAPRPVRWSIWDVTQLRAERRPPDGTLAYEPACIVTAPLNPASMHPNRYHVLFGDPANPQWQVDRARGLFMAPYLFEIGKVALDSRGGWIAFANTAAGYAFVERFAAEAGSDYPDGGADIECWTVGRGEAAGLTYDERSGPFLMETEVLSPFRHIAPGESATLDIEWGACRLDGPVVAVSEAGCANRPLTAEATGGQVTLQGDFGVFDAGRLHLRWEPVEAPGEGPGTTPGPSIDFGPVSPLEPVHLHYTGPLPSGAASAELFVVTDAWESRMLAATTVGGG